MSGAEATAVLGLISSIIAIIDVTKRVYDAATDPKGLPEAFHEVADRLPIVGSTLDSAKRNIQDGKTNEDSCKGAKHTVESCEKKAKKLEELFQKAIPADGASDLKRYVTAVRLWGKRNKVENLMKEILEDVQLLACEHGMETATKDQQEQIIKAIAGVSAVSPSVPEHELQETGFTNANFGQGTQNNYNARGEYVAQGGGRQYNAGGAMSFGPMNFHAGVQNFSVPLGPQEEETNACLRALFQTDPRDDREELITIKGPRVDGTCEWIKHHKLYKSWLRSQSQLLWLSGGPGKGKTMLSIFLAQELEEPARVSEEMLFLQYFCDNKHEKRNTARDVLRGLIHQLLQACPMLFKHILPSFRQQRETLSSFEALWRIFASMICDPALRITYCVLDGLDECDEASLEMLLGKFAALLSAKTDESSTCHLNLLIVSQDYPNFIPELLSSFPRISLDQDVDTEVSQDIDRFIKTKVKELSTRKNYSEELCAHVEKVLSNRAQGTFLWIGIAVHALRRYEATEVEKALDFLPPGLNALYARILLQVDIHRREIAARILRWVVMAVRPLTIWELSTAIETTVGPSSVPFTPDKRMRDQISYCGHFLVLKDDKIGLVHQSAKEYLLRKTPDPNPELEVFRVKEEVANHEIAKRCLDYLQSGALGNSDAFEPRKTLVGKERGLKASTFLSYATHHWHEHARSLPQSDDVFDLSQPFYHDESRTRALWLETCWNRYIQRRSSALGLKTNRNRGAKGRPPRSFTLLHLASCFDILPLAEKLVSTNSRTWNLSEKWRRSSFLEEADSDGTTALMWAAVRAHEAIIQLLLEKGAATETEHRPFESQSELGGWTETALIKAAKHGHLAIVWLLLEKGANIEAGNGMTALMRAAKRKHRTVVRLLLEKGASLEAGNVMTELMWAVECGDKGIVQLLQEKGLATETRQSEVGKFMETALIKAVEHNHLAIVRLLLERGVNTEARNKDQMTALIIASFSNHKAVVLLLMKHKANIRLKIDGGKRR